MNTEMHDVQDLGQIINKVFQAYFEISTNQKRNGVFYDYIMERVDVQGRTLALSNKVIDSYSTYENCYVLQRNLKSEDLKETVEELVHSVEGDLHLDRNHYQTTLHFIIFTPTDESLAKKVHRFSRIRFIRFGLGGSVRADVIAIDREKKTITGHTSTSKLQTLLKGELFK